MKKFSAKWCFIVIASYLILYLPGLTKLPVFADEAIYIRWAQVAVNEPNKYLFLPMLDGKPPLHPWILVPFIETLPDPLWASRFVSVLSGLITLIYLLKIVDLLNGDNQDLITTTIIVLFSPFWYFHTRLGIAEPLLVLWLTLALYSGLKFLTTANRKTLIPFSLSVAAILWTKTTALFILPMLGTIPMLSKKSYWQSKTISLMFAGIFGCGLFLLLRLSPLFPNLFNRSLDYTFTISEVVRGEWQYVLFSSLPRVVGWGLWYFTPILLAIIAFCRGRTRIYLLMVGLYCLPLILVGRVLSPRYFFPVVVPLTLAIVFAVKRIREQLRLSWLANGALVVLCVVGSVFIFLGITNPDHLPLTQSDRVSYLTEWSSGHGIKEVRDFVRGRIRNHEITVATEGMFGTLPDGLLMYFDHSPDLKNLHLFGIGQPIGDIPPELFETAKKQEVYLVINSHRFFISPLPDNIKLVASYPRPYNGPSLLLLRIYPEETKK